MPKWPGCASELQMCQSNPPTHPHTSPFFTCWCQTLLPSIQSAVYYFSFLPSPYWSSSCPCIPPSIFHPSSFTAAPYTPSFVCEASHPLSFHPSILLPPPSPPPIPSSPDVLLLSSRLPCSFLSSMPPALTVSSGWVDFLTSRGPALDDPHTHNTTPPNFDGFPSA